MEKVLAVPANRTQRLFPRGFTRANEKKLLDFIAREGQYYDRTPHLESNATLKQIIPYLILTHKGKILLYQRTAKQTEKRLHRKFSIGFGGHINPVDSRDEKNPVIGCRNRELREELILPQEPNFTFLGTLNVRYDPVEEFHLGMVYRAEMTTPEFTPGEPDGFACCQWVTPQQLKGYDKKLEGFSRGILEEVQEHPEIIQPKDALEELMVAARPFYTTNDPAHDWDHICRALHYAQVIAAQEKADWEIVSAAILFHDCVKIIMNNGGKDLSSTHSALKAEMALRKIQGFTPLKIAAVKKCIYEHTFSLGIRPKSIESKVVQDADRLDSIGTISIMRIFAHCGILGGALFSWDDPLCRKGRVPNKISYGLDWAPARLLKIPAILNTKSARKLAKDLNRNMEEFLSRAQEEINNFPADRMLAWTKIGRPPATTRH